MKNTQPENTLSLLLAQIVVHLFEELKIARTDRISPEDVASLNEILASLEQRTQKLEQLDAQNPAPDEAK